MAELTVRAILHSDESLDVTVVGREVFGKKVAAMDSKSAGIEIAPIVLDKIKKALSDARDNADKDKAVSKRAQIVAFESAQIALRMGEDI